LKSGIKSGAAAATSFSGEWFVWESVGVFSAASSFSVLDTVDQWATGFLVKGWLHVLFFDSTSSDEQVKDFQDEDTFDFAGTVSAETFVGDWVDVVESVAVEGQVGFSGTGSWKVSDFPWDATVISGGFFVIDHAAVISVREFLAKVVDAVDRLSVTSSVVVFEVTPATVLVDSVKVVVGQDVRDGSRLWSVGLDETSDVPVGEVGHLFFHGLEAGLGAGNKEG